MTDPVTATATVVTTLKNALELLQIIRKADNAKAAEQATRDLQDYIFKQNDRIVADSARIMELNDKFLACKDKIIELEQELQRRNEYTLVEIGLGVKAYIRKEEAIEPMAITGHKTPNYVCQPCYDARGKAIHILPIFNRDGVLRKWHCGGCNTDFIVHLFPPIDLSKVARML